MADEEPQESHLFGGAFSARLPPGSLDISDGKTPSLLDKEDGSDLNIKNYSPAVLDDFLWAACPKDSGFKSEMRQVPDNQEVFVHPSTDQSIIVELLEYQAGVADENAVRFHFEDIAGNSGNSEILSQTQFAPALLAFEGCSSSWQLAGHQQVAKFNEEAKNNVSVHLVLLRLPQYGTDLLVTFNDPTWINPLSTSAAQSTEVPLALSRPPWTVEHFHAFVCSLRLLDPGLFG